MHSARDSMAYGVMASECARMASAMPGTLRSHASIVASGVTSRARARWPPQVSTTSTSCSSQARHNGRRDERSLVGHHHVALALPTVFGDQRLQRCAGRILLHAARIRARDNGEGDVPIHVKPLSLVGVVSQREGPGVRRIRGIAGAKRTSGTRAAGIARKRCAPAPRSVKRFRRSSERRNPINSLPRKRRAGRTARASRRCGSRGLPAGWPCSCCAG